MSAKNSKPVPSCVPPIWDINGRIGTEIKRARIAAKLTQEQLGYQLDLDRKAIQRIEHGEGCTAERLIAFAVVLKLNLNEIIPKKTDFDDKLCFEMGRIRPQ